MENRRDVAKRETRAALVDAALEISRVSGVEALSADAIADRAGVSRRTFFNYFPTTEAVLSVPATDFVARALAAFDERPLDEPVPEAAVEALTQGVVPGELHQLVEVMVLCRDTRPAMTVERQVWDYAEGRMAESLGRRLPEDTPPLHVHVQAAMIMAAGRVAVDAWADEQHVDDGDRGHADDASVARLRSLLVEAMSHLADGFAPRS